MHTDESRFGGCFITVLYAMNVSMLGVTLFVVFGITHENIKGGITFVRSVAGIVKRGSHTSSDEDSADDRFGRGEQDIENGLRRALKGKVNEGRRGGRASMNTNHSAPLAQELSDVSDGKKGVVKTHLGTKIGIKLGGIKAPIGDCGR